MSRAKSARSGTTRFAPAGDGFEIACEVHGAGPALLLLHGFSDSRVTWHRHGWVEHLQSRFTTITMDLRGCGQSSATADAADYTPERHLADVYAVMDAYDQERFRVWGWSFGATIGIHLAAHSPRIEAAVIAGSFFGRLFTEEFALPRVQRLEHLIAIQRGDKTDPSLSPYEQRMVSQPDLPVYLARTKALISWPGVEPHQLGCPTLVYTGTADGNVVAQLRKQRPAIEAAGHRLHIHDGLDHGQLLSRPDAVWPLVAEHFDT
jgi:pimeloyl-ACP methyl ester carboxylesterase